MLSLFSFIAFQFLFSDAVYTIDNDIDVRIVADDNEFCNIGRVEFYNGRNWGSFSDCDHQFTHDIASSVCRTLGWDHAESFNHGPYFYKMDAAAPESIAYTNIYCPSTGRHRKDICDNNDCDICLHCQLSNYLDTKCSNIQSLTELHNKYDIYLMCGNENTANNPMSNLFNCSISNELHNNDSLALGFESCSDAFAQYLYGDEHDHMWKIFVILGISIGFILCVALYIKSTTRLPHKKFRDAYMTNLENNDDIVLDTKPPTATSSNYTSLAETRDALLD